jgi:hypothetical protein
VLGFCGDGDKLRFGDNFWIKQIMLFFLSALFIKCMPCAHNGKVMSVCLHVFHLQNYSTDFDEICY